MITRRTFFFAAAMGFCFGTVTLAGAQSYPTKVIKLVLPYTPGSPNDVLARLVAPPLSARLGQGVVVENRPGGGGSIGTRAVATADPDGYTLLFAASISHVISALYSGVPYDPIKDFAPIAPVAINSWVLVVPPALPANSVGEFIAYAKANPNKLNFGFGQGTAPQLVGEWLKATTGIKLTGIPYKGGAQAITDMMGGRIDINIGTTATLVPLIRDGKIKALAVMSETRNPVLAEVPTMAESGFPQLTGSNWGGILAPAGTPEAIVTRLNTEVNAILRAPEMKASIARIGFESQALTAAEYAAFLARETEKWLPIAKQSGIKMD